MVNGRPASFKTTVLGSAQPARLFPRAAGGRAKDPGNLGAQIKGFLRQETGLDMNVHAFRHLAVKLYLERHPGNHATVQMLLGHKSLETTFAPMWGL